jgi:hypothetical protein
MLPNKNLINFVALIVTIVAAEFQQIIEKLLIDGRQLKAAAQRQITFPSRFYESLLELGDDVSFNIYVRMKKSTFLKLNEYIQDQWLQKYSKKNFYRLELDKFLAATLMYLANKASFQYLSSTFGVSKAQLVINCNKIILLLVDLSKTNVRIPVTNAEWFDIERKFYDKNPIPNVAGAVDGSLIPIDRPRDFDGWYSRKGFTAFNLQVICDSTMRILSYSLRSGSNNDWSCWNSSYFGLNVTKILPRGMHILGDSGYQPRSYMLTPFPFDEAQSGKKRLYNNTFSFSYVRRNVFWIAKK